MKLPPTRPRRLVREREARLKAEKERKTSPKLISTTPPPTGKKVGKRAKSEDDSLFMFDEVVHMVCELISMRARKYEIKKSVESALLFPLTKQQFERLLSTAQSRMVEVVRQDIEVHKAHAHGFYETAIREAPEWRDRINAQRELAQLHGLVQAGKPTQDQQNLSDDERAERVREVLRQMEESTAG